MTVFLYLFGILALAGAIGTVLSRHPITSAMCLVATLLSVASTYALLEAHLIAAVQIIVYVGAIMVLIIYTILLLDLRTEDLQSRLGLTGATALVVGVAWLVSVWLRLDGMAVGEAAVLPEDFGTVKGIARQLYTEHVLTFELVGVLLLGAVIGALALATRKPLPAPTDVREEQP